MQRFVAHCRSLQCARMTLLASTAALNMHILLLQNPHLIMISLLLVHNQMCSAMMAYSVHVYGTCNPSTSPALNSLGLTNLSKRSSACNIVTQPLLVPEQWRKLRNCDTFKLLQLLIVVIKGEVQLCLLFASGTYGCLVICLCCCLFRDMSAKIHVLPQNLQQMTK